MPAYFYDKKVDKYLFTTKPPASGNKGKMIYLTDIGVGGSVWFSNGTTWRAISGKYLLDKISAPITSNNGTAFNPQRIITIPPNLAQPGDKMVLEIGFTKSGAVDNHAFNVSIGPIGTNADPTIVSYTQPQGASIVLRTSVEINFYTNVFVGSSRNIIGWGASTLAPATGVFDNTITNYISINTRFITGGTETATYYELDTFHLTGGA